MRTRLIELQDDSSDSDICDLCGLERWRHTEDSSCLFIDEEIQAVRKSRKKAPKCQTTPRK